MASIATRRAASGGFKYQRGGGHESFVDMGGIFSEMFGQRGGQRGRGFGFGGERRLRRGRFRRGRHAGDLRLTVPFLVAARGGKQRVDLPDGRTLDIDVPEGTTDGMTLRLKGQGMPGAKGKPAGDAYVEIPCSRTRSSSRATTTSMSSCR